MSGLLNSAENAIDNKMNQNAQPGDGVEAKADSTVNNDLNQAAGDVGVPQQDDKMMDTVADDKVNADIPFGNK